MVLAAVTAGRRETLPDRIRRLTAHLVAADAAIAALTAENAELRAENDRLKAGKP